MDEIIKLLINQGGLAVALGISLYANVRQALTIDRERARTAASEAARLEDTKQLLVANARTLADNTTATRDLAAHLTAGGHR